MFSHVMVGANDLEASRKFYDAVLGTLKIAPGVINNEIRYFYRSPKGSFSITKPIDGQAATAANGGTTCEDLPGPREGPFGALYLAYLRDPSGNKICALHRPSKPD